MVTHAHPCCPMPTPTVSVPCNLTALHEFYGFGFQGHLRGGGCFPSSLLGLSGVQCPSATLSLTGARGKEKSHELLTDRIPARGKRPTQERPDSLRGGGGQAHRCWGPLRTQHPGTATVHRKTTPHTQDASPIKQSPLRRPRGTGHTALRKSLVRVRTGPEPFLGPTSLNLFGLTEPFLLLAQRRSVSQVSVRAESRSSSG